MVQLGKWMTMADLLGKLDDILRTYDYPVFPGYADWRAARNAERHVERQLEAYKALAAGDGQEERDAGAQGLRLPA